MTKFFAACTAIALICIPAQAATILNDDFSGASLSTSGAVGSGFAVASGSGATVSGGMAVVGTSGSIDQNIYSLDTFNPSNTTLTWVVSQRPTVGAAGVAIGWSKSGIGTCAGCGPEIWLEARNDRTVLLLQNGSSLYAYDFDDAIGGTGSITMSLSLTNTGYSWSISDTGYSASSAGAWVNGFSLADVMSAAGGNLSVFASTRSDNPGSSDVGLFDSVTVTSNVPEPASWTMMIGGFSLVGATMRRRKPTVSFT